ncbi:S-adenosyl-L-methionine-dependent methyltransferase [Talaromyces proteolyticus]|uniref:S-adenosyl-L-methionine-dependent methyltransferase n=1 Tax=Talaromyces proteolyticus TaxID=1131652 RepID=A0AAD4L505_9EURO|nr:S-adenosyl-L-methionine-dependent methyltransferase [Talaromyces proteolyticus]KAH8703677.1 S-adenosyl-L-methionine-dependent methyltransferase [Talaromyces proteolyticus]
MADLLAEVRKRLTSEDEVSRKLFQRELHETIASAETPKETAIRLSLYPLQAAAARIGHDLKIFQTLDTKGPQTLKDLQASTGAHPLTLGRLLRYMASVGLIHQSAADRFEANSKCHHLAAPEAITIVTHFFENCGPLFQEMPAFLRKNNYQDVTDGKATVFQPAYNTELDTYAYFSQHPENMQALIKYMGLEQGVRGRWLQEYPFEKQTQGWNPNPEEALFVDIGGNVGHYCALFKSRFSEIPGRILLEDLTDTLTHALPTPGVEKLGHDFFQPQPIKGAKFYHLGWVLRNWSDEKAKTILRQIKSAMTPRSVLLINDMILPETQIPPFATALDLVMLGACGSLERTGEQWKDLLKEVGLEIKEAIVYDHELFHGIISATVA